MKAVEGLAASKTLPQIALDVYGADTVADRGLHADGDLRAAAHRLVTKARFLMKGGYLELAAGRRPPASLIRSGAAPAAPCPSLRGAGERPRPACPPPRHGVPVAFARRTGAVFRVRA